jgi:predicted anti-sigma-YlaC factor YlaD
MQRRRRLIEQHLSVVGSDLSCSDYEDALSALADNEPSLLASEIVERHLVGCVSCRQFQTAIRELAVAPVLAVVDAPVDEASRISRIIAKADRDSRPETVRYFLGVVAASIILLAIPELFASDTSGAAAHADRHLGSFSAAYGVLLFVTVLRPARARTALPVSVVLAAAIGITAISDLTRGKIPLVGEVLHLPELLSVILVWLLARRTTVRP